MSDATKKNRRRWSLIAIWLATCLVAAPVLAVAVFLAVVPPPVADFRPAAWTPGSGLAVDPAAQSNVTATPLGTDEPYGPEDIAIDASGAVYTGDRDGRILRMGADGASAVFADVGGRPLGLAFDADGHLIVANHGEGLQSVAPDGSVSLLADEADGQEIRFANDLAIAPDGTIWFSDSSSRYNTTTLGDVPSYLMPDFIDGRATGRLLQYDPAAASVEVVLDELYFPNGVALDDEGTAVWIAESTRYRILEYTIATKELDVLVDDVPGIPDGVNLDANGSFLVALYDRTPALDSLVLPTALGRELMIRLPNSLFVNEDNPLSGGVLVLEADGSVRHWYTGLRPAATNAVPHDGNWYLGALLGHPVRMMPAP